MQTNEFLWSAGLHVGLQHQEARVVEMPVRARVRFSEECRNPDEVNSAFDLVLQVGPENNRLSAVLELFVQVRCFVSCLVLIPLCVCHSEFVLTPHKQKPQ